MGFEGFICYIIKYKAEHSVKDLFFKCKTGGSKMAVINTAKERKLDVGTFKKRSSFGDDLIERAIINMWKYTDSIYDKDKSHQVVKLLCTMVQEAMSEEDEAELLSLVRMDGSEQDAIVNGGEIVSFIVNALLDTEGACEIPGGNECLEILYEDLFE